jgi:hypothetical protein
MFKGEKCTRTTRDECCEQSKVSFVRTDVNERCAGRQPGSYEVHFGAFIITEWRASIIFDSLILR